MQSLEKLYERNDFTFAVVYGRRRVGKTSLIAEFIRRGDKKAICFTATESTDIINLRNFSENVFSVYPELSTIVAFPTWESAFTYIAQQSKGEKLVVEIDEYPYLAKNNPAISSEIQKCIDLILLNTNIMLILCGSSISFMENQILGYQSPLYGRRTAQYHIKPLDYYDSAEFFESFDLSESSALHDKLLGYAVTGGVPQYLSEIALGDNVEDGIARAFFSKQGFLYEEPQNLLKQELREPALYNAIITVIAGGAAKLGEIAAKVKETDSKTAKYVKNLIDLGILEKEISIFAQNGRNGIYCIKDSMYRFWYRFVPNTVTLIENGYERVFEARVKPLIPEYMGRIFESICRQYLLRLNIMDKLPFLFDDIGRWLGGSPITKRETEIDIVATSKEGMIVGECKWQNEATSLNVYRGLVEKAAMFTVREKFYYLFSKSGFSASLLDEAKKDDKLTLVNMEELFIFDK